MTTRPFAPRLWVAGAAVAVVLALVAARVAAGRRRLPAPGGRGGAERHRGGPAGRVADRDTDTGTDGGRHLRKHSPPACGPVAHPFPPRTIDVPGVARRGRRGHAATVGGRRPGRAAAHDRGQAALRLGPRAGHQPRRPGGQRPAQRAHLAGRQRARQPVAGRPADRATGSWCTGRGSGSATGSPSGSRCWRPTGWRATTTPTVRRSWRSSSARPADRTGCVDAPHRLVRVADHEQSLPMSSGTATGLPARGCEPYDDRRPTMDEQFEARLEKSPATRAVGPDVGRPGSAEYFGTRGLVKVARHGRRRGVPELLHGARRRPPQGRVS